MIKSKNKEAKKPDNELSIKSIYKTLNDIDQIYTRNPERFVSEVKGLNRLLKNFLNDQKQK